MHELLALLDCCRRQALSLRIEYDRRKDIYAISAEGTLPLGHGFAEQRYAGMIQLSGREAHEQPRALARALHELSSSIDGFFAGVPVKARGKFF